MKLLSLCTGMGLMDRAFMDAGHQVIAGCEIDPEMRAMYRELCGSEPLVHDIKDLRFEIMGCVFDGVIGGPPCQSHTKLRAMRKPKYPDLSSAVEGVLEELDCETFVFENVAPLPIEGAKSIRMNAMHYHRPHQSRVRWFTYQGVKPPKPKFDGNVDSLRAYPVVAGRIYGPKRGAWLQGYEPAAELPFPCVQLQKGLANAVPYPLALAWAKSL